MLHFALFSRAWCVQSTHSQLVLYRFGLTDQSAQVNHIQSSSQLEHARQTFKEHSTEINTYSRFPLKFYRTSRTFQGIFQNIFQDFGPADRLKNRLLLCCSQYNSSLQYCEIQYSLNFVNTRTHKPFLVTRTHKRGWIPPLPRISVILHPIIDNDNISFSSTS